MLDYKPGRHEHQPSTLGSEALGEWESEGGSLCWPSVENREVVGSSALYADSGIALLEALPLGILITNRMGEITYSNPAAQKLFGASASELLGTAWWLAIDPLDRPAASARWQKGVADGRSPTFEVRLTTSSGRPVWTRHSIARLRSCKTYGDHIHTVEDISGAKAAEKAGQNALEILYRERERARVTLECIGDAVISTDSCGRVTYLNTVAEHLTGWSRDVAAGQPLSRVFSVIDSDSRSPISNLAERAMESLEIVQMPANSLLLRPDGSELAIEDSAAPILDESGRLTGAVLVFRDRMLSRENTTRMAYLARHDALTGLPNRVAFSEHFTQATTLAKRHGKRVGLLFIDVDHFKQINDSLGHEVGDRLLRDLSSKLVACVRSTDLVCRHGGDEFVVLLGEIGQVEDAGKIAVKMQHAVARLRHSEGQAFDLKLSIGISVYPEDGSDLEELIHRADSAMYQAKLDAGQQYCFYRPGMERPAAGAPFRKASSKG